MQLQQRTAMINPVSHHGPDNTKVVNTGTHVRKQVTHFDTALAIMLELPRRLHQASHLGLIKSERSLEGQRFSIVQCQAWFGIEGIDMRRSSMHEEKNDTLGPGGEMAGFGRQRTRKLCRVVR